jgi:hypothetical protein
VAVFAVCVAHESTHDPQYQPPLDLLEFPPQPDTRGSVVISLHLPLDFLFGDGLLAGADDDPLSRLTGTGIFGDPNQQPSSDHRLVWIDVSHGGFPRD